MPKIFFSASQQDGNKYHCSGLTERQYCERLVDRIIVKLPQELSGVLDHELNYAQRPKYAKQQGCNAYVTIHTNGFNGKARGLEIGTSGSAQDKPLAEAIYKVLEPLTPAADRGIKKYNFTEAVEPIMPSCYIELSFHDNHEDEQWLIANVEQIAGGIILGLCGYFKIKAQAERTYTAAEYSAAIAERNSFKQRYDSLVATVIDTIQKLEEEIK